jgi:hypothetical protein
MDRPLRYFFSTKNINIKRKLVTKYCAVSTCHYQNSSRCDRDPVPVIDGVALEYGGRATPNAVVLRVNSKAEMCNSHIFHSPFNYACKQNITIYPAYFSLRGVLFTTKKFTG